jgi:transcriptional regulator with XRE-family HTH domain
MTTTVTISGRLVAAARALAGVSQDAFAQAADLSLERVAHIEAGGTAQVESEADRAALCRGLEHFGILLVEEADGMGAGVRLKFTRLDTRQLARLEGEGGIIASDDAP